MSGQGQVASGGGRFLARPMPQLLNPEPLVSCSLQACLGNQRTLLLATKGQDQLFVLIQVLRETLQCDDVSNFRLLLIVSRENQQQPWAKALATLTQLKEDQYCVKTRSEVTTEGDFALIVLLNAQSYLHDSKSVSDWLPLSPRTRLLCFSCPLVPNLPTQLLPKWDPLIEMLRKHFEGCTFEANGELLNLLKNQSPPRTQVVQYESNESPNDLTGSIEKRLLEDLGQITLFLKTHTIDLENYQDFEEQRKEMAYPQKIPLEILNEWLDVLNEFGIWAAERAALILCIQLDKLKTMAKYERHFILLSVVYTHLSKVRRIIEMAYTVKSERERMLLYSRPKVVRLVNILLKFKPAHVGIAQKRKTKKGKASLTNDEKIPEEPGDSAKSADVEESSEEKASHGRKCPDPKEESKSEDTVESLRGGNIHDMHIIDPKDLPLEEPKEETSPSGSAAPLSTRVPRKRRKQHQFSSYEDPHSLHCALFVQKPFHAKILYHYLNTLSREDDSYSFLSPQYVVPIHDMSIDKWDKESQLKHDSTYVANKRKREEALRRFRVRESNILLTSAYQEPGLDSVRCNLVIAMDPPKNFFEHASVFVKTKAAMTGASFLLFTKSEQTEALLRQLAEFRVIQNRMTSLCVSLKKKQALEDLTDMDETTSPIHASVSACVKYQPGDSDHQCATVDNAIGLVNRYCAKLPSDSFTRLAPIHKVIKDKSGAYICGLQLPINSPLKETVFGVPMPTIQLARCAAAVEAVKRLHLLRELDDNLAPHGKESLHREVGRLLQKGEESVKLYEPELPPEENVKNLGTTKRRQYYTKQVAPALRPLNEPKVSDSGDCNKRHVFKLYSIDLKLTCAIPDDQNTRGRRVHPPELASQSFGFLAQAALPSICPFPIYTRSGEVAVSLSEIIHEGTEINVSAEELELIQHFHNYTFSQVLRLQKHPMVFEPSNSENSLLVLPLTKDVQDKSKKVVDFDFLKRIKAEGSANLHRLTDEERKGFEFNEELYTDAVVMPWYRNQDQPQYFYVAEICPHLSPKSDFPGQGFKTFERYYQSKYGIQVQNVSQPLLDVDHTSARLNFLTPRYVNRKGVALPTSSEETKRNKRENLDQKQILVPELCSIHPFKASLWRQTVCLPSIFYRLNALFIADNLRLTVAKDVNLGRTSLAKDYEWGMLHFGWTLADVLKNRKSKLEPIDMQTIKSKLWAMKSKSSDKDNSFKTKHAPKGIQAAPEVDTEKRTIDALNQELTNKMTEDEKNKKKNLEIGTWTNDMAYEADNEEMNSFEDDEEQLMNGEFTFPENLTILTHDMSISASTTPSGRSSSSESLSKREKKKGGSNWGTGIEQKPVRVGSPTYLNQNINIPGARVEHDLDGFSTSTEDYSNISCSEIEDECWSETQQADEEMLGTYKMRVEYRGDNMAEAFENKDEEQKRIDILAKDRAEEAAMTEDLRWPEDLKIDSDCQQFQVDVELTWKKLSSCKDLVLDHNSEWEKPIRIYNNFQRENPPDNVDPNEFPRSEEDVSESKKELIDRLLFQPLREALVKKDNSNRPPGQGFIPFDSDCADSFFDFDLQPNLEGDYPGPSPSLLLQAITMSNSNDAINLERLETIGDSFLKYAITAFLFCQNPNVHEGKLSHMRSKQVSNVHLYQLGRRKRLGEVMIATKFEPYDNWLPPGYRLVADGEKDATSQGTAPVTDWQVASTAIRKGDEKSRGEEDPILVPYNLLTQHSIPDKSIADCVESLIGAYLTSSGPKGALLFMSWLGMNVYPQKEAQNGFLVKPESPLLTHTVPRPRALLDVLLAGYEEFEDLIGYKFRDRSYLLQAFTHTSYWPNRLTDCYQRLEFLGDAVLDYLITRFLYEDQRKHSPGTLTDLRSALVNNTIFASLAVKYHYHKYFRHLSPSLQNVINRFVRIQALFHNRIIIHEGGGDVDATYPTSEPPPSGNSVGSGDPSEAEDVEVPKALGDIFESVAGAIYLDSGLSLNTVWKVYYRMMKEEIELFSKAVPKSPIRELLELEPETVRFAKPEKLSDGKRVRVSVEVFGRGSFKGIGRNYRIAKSTAAKCALRALRSKAK